ncbi:MAG: PIN domain-containing protein, partial [Algiphilus sp.]
MTDHRIFVLDTNVLMHDPSALYRFEEHDIYIPMVVLEELDAAKKGTSEVSRNARQVSRMLDEIVSEAGRAQIADGLPLTGDRPRSLQAASTAPAQNGEASRLGRIFFQTRPAATALPDLLPGNKPDNSILICALSLANEQPDAAVTLVSKDINLRIKAAVIGIHAEDYFNDQVLEDVDLLHSG